MLKVSIIIFGNMLQEYRVVQQPKILDNKQQGRVIDELRQGINNRKMELNTRLQKLKREMKKITAQGSREQ